MTILVAILMSLILILILICDCQSRARGDLQPASNRTIEIVLQTNVCLDFLSFRNERRQCSRIEIDRERLPYADAGFKHDRLRAHDGNRLNAVGRLVFVLLRDFRSYF